MRKIQPGDIFQVNLSNEEISYIQYIKQDIYYLDSDLIRIYNYRNIKKLSLDELINIDFIQYYRTWIKHGIKNKILQKMGNIKLESNIKIPLFKQENSDLLSENKWIVWDNDGNKKFFKELPVQYENLPLASIVEPSFLVKIIELGHHPWDPHKK